MNLSYRRRAQNGATALACALLAAACLPAQDAAKSSPPAPVAQTKPAPARLAIPKDAVETSVGFYRWTDKDGKIWVYRRTMFGVSRWPATRDGDSGTQDADGQKTGGQEHITAVEQGDSIRFDQATPFGRRTWVRKKSELTEVEKAIWERQHKDMAADRAAEKE